jgi:uncharacterized protein (TIGR02145 family)
VIVLFAVITLCLVVQSGSQTTPEFSRMPEVATFVDPRDSTIYRTVRLGSQLWLGENLRFNVQGSWAYGGDSTNARLYGRLYDWDAASCACPAGWHLPTAAEWSALFEYLGGLDVAGGRLKQAGTEHWKAPNSGATNISQFGGLPGGGRRKPDGTFHGLGMFGAFWSSTEKDDKDAWAFYLGYHYPEVSLRPSTSKGFGYSVRCLRDQGPGVFSSGSR